MNPAIRFDHRVAIVTGAGGGLGRTYALDLAARGAAVVVNDLGGSFDGQGSSTSMADRVVAEIEAAGGTAVASYDSVSTSAGGAAIVKTAIAAFGRLDVLISNAGSLRNAPLDELSDETLDAMLDVHLNGRGVAGMYPWEVAETKVETVTTLARDAGYPLKATIEEA